jgi:hypothetical protein
MSIDKDEMTWLDISTVFEKRVQIYVSVECGEEEGRFELSAGTRSVCDTDLGHEDYDAFARVPQEPWRQPNEAERVCLFSRVVPSDMSRTVGIVKVVDKLKVLEGRLEDVELDRKSVNLSRRSFYIKEATATLGLTSNPPGLITTTFDGAPNKKIGLHVDSWEELASHRRESSWNRICVNIGKEPRYFLFLPISVVDIAGFMAGEIGQENLPDPRDVTELGRIFMELFPQVPVVRCRLAPYEAYIAPTENLIHDGSSLGQRHIDQHFTVLGRIAIV